MATKTVSAASRATQRRKKRRRQRGALTGVILVFILALMAFTGVFAWGVMLEKGKTIYPNVHMAGVDVGGLTMGEARTKVETAVAEAYTASTLEVQLPDRSITFDPEQANVALDTEEALREALSYGRSDGAFKAVLNYLKCSTSAPDIPLETSLEFDREAIRQTINETAVQVRKAPVNTTLALDEDKAVIQVVKGQDRKSVV